MGDIKRKRKSYDRPRNLFDRERIDQENKIVSEYGLKNKREIWKAKSVTSKLRKRAKDLISKPDEEKQKLIEKLNKKGIAVKDISGVLGLNEKDILDRRLQTILFKKKMAGTVKQARQLVVHKYVLVNGSVVNSPSFWVTKELEGQIEVRPKKIKPVKEAAPVEETAEEKPAEEVKEEAALEAKE
ncbi:30S ribosomal protein S4 [Candidatus Pacearchaeota archaeon]|jgi:small subunit ribosomal protein S4|nr:30S ribosomal protein S4 [Candidatus Pacearchaeota archaeon]|tara:strand:- start:14303 stop:14857 length:555 start_codon:yes stop_codon:yes gene_type:complete